MYKKEKTNQEWDKIRFQNSVGPQVGGIGHDVAVLVAAGIKPTKENIADMAKWYKEIYCVAETIKKIITTPQPVSNQEATQAGIDFNKRIERDSKVEDINDGLNRAHHLAEEAIEKEADKREDQQQKWGADNNGRQ